MFGELNLRAWSIADFLIAAIILAACVGIALIAFKAFKIPIPEWAIQIFWVVVIACVAIVAIRIVLSL